MCCKNDNVPINSIDKSELPNFVYTLFENLGVQHTNSIFAYERNRGW